MLAQENSRNFPTLHHCFPREMSSENRLQKFNTDDLSNFCSRFSDDIFVGKPVVSSRTVGCFLRLRSGLKDRTSKVAL